MLGMTKSQPLSQPAKGKNHCGTLHRVVRTRFPTRHRLSIPFALNRLCAQLSGAEWPSCATWSYSVICASINEGAHFSILGELFADYRLLWLLWLLHSADGCRIAPDSSMASTVGTYLVGKKGVGGWVSSASCVPLKSQPSQRGGRRTNQMSSIIFPN